MPLSNKIPFLSFDKIENIDYAYLKDLGIKGLIFDLDNTIICPNEELIPKSMIQFLKKLEKQFKIVIVTNNSKYRMRNKSIITARDQKQVHCHKTSGLNHNSPEHTKPL